MAIKDQDLDALFAAARDQDMPGDDLIARVLADAETVQESFGAKANTNTDRASSFWGLFSAIGGWRGAGGLVAASVTGLMIGVYAPDQLDTVLGGGLSEYGFVDAETYWPGLDDLLPAEEG